MNAVTKEFKESRNGIHGKVIVPCKSKNYTYMFMMIKQKNMHVLAVCTIYFIPRINKVKHKGEKRGGRSISKFHELH